MKTRTLFLASLALLSTLNSQLSTAFAQGSLTPPGAPAPTMKSLDQVEPRTPISTLPFTITAAGSYYLTANLTGVAGTNGITLTANDTTLDLNGFALVGVAGSLSGIRVSGTHTNIGILNGTVRNWGANGVDASTAIQSLFEKVRATDNGFSGILGGSGSVIRDCLATGNNTANGGSQYGIQANRATIIGCVFNNNLNGAQGFSGVGGANVIINCVASGNSDDGIFTGFNSLVVACNASGNGSRGIRGGDESTIKDCVVYFNTSDGIIVSLKSVVSGNMCENNGSGGSGAGIRATSYGNRIEGNHVTDNDRGIEINTGATNNVVVRNTVGRNPPTGSLGSSNYVFNAFTIFGPTNNVFNPATGAITNLNPWANISY